MTVLIHTSLFHEQHPELSKRALNRVTRAANQAMGEYWADNLVKEHFEPAAHFIFGHKNRSLKYRKKKRYLASKGKVQRSGEVDLVYSGQLERYLTGNRHVVRAYPTRVTITMIGPKHWTMRPRNPNRPNLAKEVTTVTGHHERLMAGVADRITNEQLTALRAAKTTRAA